MKKFLKKLSIAAVLGFAFLGGYKAFASQIPISPSVFETYLANQMSTTDTTLTLASAMLRDGTALSGYACVTIDSNTPVLEYTCGTVSGNTITNLVRGIDPVTGITTETGLIFSHRRGADVKITDYPTLTILSRILSGVDVFPNPIAYDPSISTSSLTTNQQNLATVNYVNSVAFSGAGIVNATASVSGVVQLATALQQASSTSIGSSGASLVLIAANATSTYNSATAGRQVVVTQPNGKIDSNFLTGGAPTGEEIQYASTTAPSGFLEEDGSSYSDSLYPNLYAVIGTTYGSVDSTHFNVPDRRGRTLVDMGIGTKIASTTSVSGNTFTVTGLTNANNNEFQTGEPVAFAATVAGNLVNGTTYYVIRVSNTTFNVASTLANAQNGSAITLAGTESGKFTLTLSTRTLGDTGGEEKHAMSSTEVLAQSYSVTTYSSGGSTPGNIVGNGNSSIGSSNTNSQGGNSAMNIMSPFDVTNFIIKY